jgi:acetyl-CoA carboxylase carboxyltransferase component
VLARVVDGSRFGQYKPLWGTSLVTGWASVHGFTVGILANARGVLFSEEAKKASEFIQLANQSDTPLLFLQNTTGYMVGTSYEQRGIIKDGAKLINAVAQLAGVLSIVARQAAVFEAMKMEHPVKAPAEGVVAEVLVGVGQTVDAGAPLAVIVEKVKEG